MTTTPTTTPRSAARRLLSISATATIAAVGLLALSVPATPPTPFESVGLQVRRQARR
jgi:hypothetical protein